MAKTKWVPLTFFECSGHTFCILARMNMKTGMVYFRQKRVNRITTHLYRNPNLDINAQFQSLLKQVEN